MCINRKIRVGTTAGVRRVSFGQTIGESIAGAFAGGGGASSQGQSAGQGEQRGGFFSAIGDFFGFDGDFGYDGVNGPDGMGRHLSLAGLGDSVGGFLRATANVFGFDGEFGYQTPRYAATALDSTPWRPTTTDAPQELPPEEDLDPRNVLKAVGRALGFVAKRGGPVVAAGAVLWPYDLGGGTQHVDLAFEDDLRLSKHPHDTNWRLEVRTEEGIIGDLGAQWRGVADGFRLSGDEFVTILDPAGAAERLGRDLPGNAIVALRGDKGFGVTIHSEDEAVILNDGIARGWDSNRINAELAAFRSSFGSALSLSQGRSVWDLGWGVRGIEIEKGILGDRYGLVVPAGFRTIDDFDNGIATSIKSINLNARSYHNINRLDRLLTGYVNRLADFDGGTFGDILTIRPGQTTSRELVVAIPNRGTAAQNAALARAIQYGADNGVIVRYREVR